MKIDPKAFWSLDEGKRSEMETLLETLGLPVPPRPKPRKDHSAETRRAFPPLEEHTVRAISKCALCGHIQVSYRHMQWDQQAHALIGKPVETPPEGTPIRETRHLTKVCFNCRNFLSDMSKEELIEVVMTTAKKNPIYFQETLEFENAG